MTLDYISQPEGLPIVAALETCWAAGVRELVQEAIGTDAEGSWKAWALSAWPGAAELLPASSPANVWQHLVQQPASSPAPEVSELLAPWVFFVDIRRVGKSLWRAAIGESNALPGKFSPEAVAPNAPSKDFAEVYERMDVALPGEKRRMCAASAIAALSQAAERKKICEDHFARVVAVHQGDGRVLTLPAVLVSGCRHSLEAALPLAAQEASRALLTAVVGIGMRGVLPGPRAQYPYGSMEVRVGLAFLGPDGGWLRGDAFAAGALLEASWSVSSRRKVAAAASKAA